MATTLKKRFQIGGQWVGRGEAPFVIAEMSGNHDHSLDKALEIVDAAAEAGVDALKLQTYTADTMTLDVRTGPFLIDDPKSLWHGKNLYELYDEAHTPWEWHAPIMERCKAHGLICFSSPFDTSAVEFLETLNVPVYKIASFENTDIPLLECVAATGKPVIMSTGMASLDELDESVSTLQNAGCENLALLKCTSAYPAHPSVANLGCISELEKRYQCVVGISDHTLGIGVSVAAVALGGAVIEKHFTLRRSDGGVDAAFSMEPQEMFELVAGARMAQQAVQGASFELSERERASLQYRRSLWVVKDVPAGHVLTADDIRALRPAGGLVPKHLKSVIGCRTVRAIKCGTPMSWDLVESQP